MKKLIRLTESDLHKMIVESVKRILREDDDSALLNHIANELSKLRSIDVTQGENEEEVPMGDGNYAIVSFYVESNPYMKQGQGGGYNDDTYDADEVVDNVVVKDVKVIYYTDANDEVVVDDNGMIANVLQDKIVVDYNDNDIPSEQDYFYSED